MPLAVPLTKDQQWYLSQLSGEECFCDRPKKRGYAFCYSCYMKLPKNMQKDLYQKIGAGYEEAYTAAIRFME